MIVGGTMAIVTRTALVVVGTVEVEVKVAVVAGTEEDVKGTVVVEVVAVVAGKVVNVAETESSGCRRKDS